MPERLADVVDRTRRHVPHAGVPDVQVHEQVVREAVARVDAVEVERLEHRQGDRRVAGLRVGDVPVAGGDLRQQGKHGVAEVARVRDQLPGLAGEEAVCLGVVDLAAGDRLGDRLELAGIHLVVGRHDAGDVDPLLDRAPVARDDRRANATVPFVRDEDDAGIGLGGGAGSLGGVVGRGVVDDDHTVDEVRDPRQRLRQQDRLVVGRDHHGNALAVEHPGRLRRSLVRAHLAGHRLPEDRRQQAEDEADDRADHDARAAARAALARRRGVGDDPRRLDAQRLCDRLPAPT